jgi:hypothetical protein
MRHSSAVFSICYAALRVQPDDVFAGNPLPDNAQHGRDELLVVV